MQKRKRNQIISNLHSPKYCSKVMKKKPKKTEIYGSIPDLSFDKTSKKITQRRVPVAKPCNITFGTSRYSLLEPEVKMAPTKIPNKMKVII